MSGTDSEDEYADADFDKTLDEIPEEDLPAFCDNILWNSSQSTVNSSQPRDRTSSPPPRTHDSEEEYDKYDLNEFTPKELYLAERGSLTAKRAHYVHNIIDGGRPEPAYQGQLKKSPHATFLGHLSHIRVSDLVAPSWCEFQNSYNHIEAMEKRNEPQEPPPKKRKVEKSSSMTASDEMLKGCASATATFNSRHHKTPEEPDPRSVDDIFAVTHEDSWARRLVKLILCIDSLIRFGSCQGMDLVGSIDGMVVTGKAPGVTLRPENPTARVERASSGRQFPSPVPEIELHQLKEEPCDVKYTTIDRLKVEPGVFKVEPASQCNRLEHKEVKLEHDNIKLEPDDDIKLESDDNFKLELGDGVKLEPKDVKVNVNEAHIRMIMTFWEDRPLPKRYTPNKRTEKKTCLKLMYYRRLLLDLLSPHFTFAPIWETLGIEPDRPLTLQFLKHADMFVRLDNTLTLNDIANEVYNRRTQLVNAIVNSTLVISYRSEDGESHPNFEFEYSAAYLESYNKIALQYWRGERDAQGVDVEDAWKCRTCKHSGMCWWRQTDGGTKPQNSQSTSTSEAW